MELHGDMVVSDNSVVNLSPKQCTRGWLSRLVTYCYHKTYYIYISGRRNQADLNLI